MTPVWKWLLVVTACCLVPGLAATVHAKDAKSLYILSPELQADPEGQGRATLTVKATQGYKWNKEFPCKVVIGEQKGAKLARTKYAKGDVKLADGDKTAIFDLGATGKVEPGTTITGKASFSLCTKKVCKIFMNKDVTWKPAPASGK
ncbi:MAG: hypothetical protein ISR64_04045 [Deltaproteobacteria bacterium]|nr:hypothetical protein [Deltaproteobacteria bacterium]